VVYLWLSLGGCRWLAGWLAGFEAASDISVNGVHRRRSQVGEQVEGRGAPSMCGRVPQGGVPIWERKQVLIGGKADNKLRVSPADASDRFGERWNRSLSFSAELLAKC